MRESCLICARKHIAQAIVLLIESRLGHPHHFWLAMGHLAEAEAETLTKFPDFAKRIRYDRLNLVLNENKTPVELEHLIKEASLLYAQDKENKELDSMEKPSL